MVGHNESENPIGIETMGALERFNQVTEVTTNQKTR